MGAKPETELDRFVVQNRNSVNGALVMKKLSQVLNKCSSQLNIANCCWI